METLESAPKTLAEGFSLPSEPAKSKGPEEKTPDKASFGSNGDDVNTVSGLDGSVRGTGENGVRVSINEKDVMGDSLVSGVVELVKSRVVEIEISAEKSFRDQEINGLGESEYVIEDSDMKGSVGDFEVERSGRETVKALGVEKTCEKVVEIIAAEDKLSGGDGVALMDVCGITRNIDVKQRSVPRKSRGEEDGSFLGENGGDPDVNIKEGSESEDDGEEDSGDEVYEYSVGDFVWGRTHGNIWWPGRIYDPSDATEYALKFKKRARFLVAYFGDGSFAWCHQSQLKPWVEYFGEMFKQSNLNNFMNAVEKTVEEIGKLVELEMTCCCVSKECQVGLGRPLTVNTGIKNGVFVPDGGIGKLSIAQFVPDELLADLRYIAQVLSASSMVDFTVLKSRLSAFYCSKGGYPLSMFHEPQPIPGLEDNVRNGVMDTSDCNRTMEVPGPSDDESLSLPVGPGWGLQKCSRYSEDNVYQRMKQKSMAEIMGGDRHNDWDMVEEGKQLGKPAATSGHKKRKSREEANGQRSINLHSTLEDIRKTRVAGSSMTTQSKVGKVSNVKTDGGGNNKEAKKRPRKKEKDPGIEDGGGGGGSSDNKNGPVLMVRKGSRGSSFRSVNGEVKEQVEKDSASRERKKSKYLSPPYTSLYQVERKRVSEKESLKVSSVAGIKERMTKDTGHLIEKSQKKNSEELGVGHEESDKSTPERPNQDQNKIIDPVKVKAPAIDVLSEIRCAATNPLYLKNQKSLDMVWEYLSVFRSSIFSDGSNYIEYNRHRSSRKRESLNSAPGSFAKDRNQTDNSIGHEWRQRRIKKNVESKLDKPELKQAAAVPNMKKKDKKTDRKASSAAILFVSFGPGSSLPSKNDLIKIYSKFGALDEVETKMLYNNFCARVVFLSSSDAEEAFDNSQTTSPFGAVDVSYRLRYPSGASKKRALNEISPPKTAALAIEGCKAPKGAPASRSSVGEASRAGASKIRALLEISHPKVAAVPIDSGFNEISPPNAPALPNEGCKTPKMPPASLSSAGEASQLNFVRQKLVTMTSMLEKSNGEMSRELKSKLEGELKGLLEKVSSKAGACSS